MLAGSAQAEQPQFPDGVWLSRGYGVLVDSAPDATSIYQYDSSAGCTLVERELPSAKAASSEQFVPISAENEQVLRVQRVGSIGHIVFDKIAARPASCNSEAPRDAVAVLDSFCRGFQSHYAFFEERKIDWRARCAQAHEKIRPDSSDDLLFATLVGLIEPLDDRHVRLVAGDRVHISGLGPVIKPIFARYSKAPHAGPFRPFLDAALAPYKTATLARNLHGNAQSAANGHVMWGWAKPGIGYVWIGAFTGFAASPEASPAEHLQIFRSALDRAMADLGGAKAIIVDLRLAIGGSDIAALELAGRFARRPWMAFSKQTRSLYGLTDPQWFYVQPAGKEQYKGPVGLLVSNFSVSAAENFGMAMMMRPEPVAIVGERTAGVHSDVLPWRLPNGWIVTISNEIFRSSNGVVYETQGLPPSVEAPFFDNQTLKGSSDRGLEAALAALGIR